MGPIFTKKVNVIVANNMSADYTSDGVDISECSGYSVQAVYTGTFNGDLEVQGSHDGTTYSVVSHTSITTAGSFLQNYDGAHYKYVRVFYDRNSGSGTLDVSICAKTI